MDHDSGERAAGCPTKARCGVCGDCEHERITALSISEQWQDLGVAFQEAQRRGLMYAELKRALYAPDDAAGGDRAP